MIMTDQRECSALQETYIYGKSLVEQDNPNTIRKAFLFGFPISHSPSPPMHHTFWKALNLRWKFNLVESMSQDDFIAALRAPDCVGCSITMPHKSTAMSFIDDLTKEARIIGAINTIFVRLDPRTNERRYIGTNTDCIGIRDAIERTFPDAVQGASGKPALIVGAGGTTRAAIYTLWKFFNVREIYIVNRIESEVNQVIESMITTGCTIKMTPVKTVSEAQELDAPYLAVGTVPDIPALSQKELQAKAVTRELLMKGPGILLDMCYHPHLRTSLLNLGEELGWQTVSGIEAMKYQGVVQNSLWSEAVAASGTIDDVSRAMYAAVHE